MRYKKVNIAVVMIVLIFVCVIIKQIYIVDNQEIDVNERKILCDLDSGQYLQWFYKNTSADFKNYNQLAWEGDIFRNIGIDIGYDDEIRFNPKREVIVAVLDAGVNLQNVAVTDFVWYNKNEIVADKLDNDKNGYIDDVLGWDFVNNSAKLISRDGYSDNHATFVAGLIAGKGDVHGVVQNDMCKLMCLKVTDEDSGTGSIENVISAIEYAEHNGAQVCCMSLNSYSEDERLRCAIQDSNMLFVVSAGNDGECLDESMNNYPTCYQLENVISVADLRCDGKLSKTSNYGNCIDIAAPGTDILSICGTDSFCYMSGTSCAAPLVAGAAALVFQKSEMNMSAYDAKMVITNHVSKNFYLKGKVSSEGFLNISAALASIE